MPQRSTGPLRTSWGHFKKYRPLIRELVTRDLKVKYRRSFLGYVWSILNPLLFVSHDIDQVKRLCKRAIWIDHGHLRGDGPAQEVCDAYVAAMQNGE